MQNKQQGIALVIVLWMLALMTIIALAFSGMTRTESLLSNNMIRSAQARAEAESGIWLAVNDLLKPNNNRRFAANGLPVQLRSDPDRKLTISILDESGKVDLNKASEQLLIGLISSAGIDFDQTNQIVDAILDWRDKDDLTRLNGAEDDDYKSNGYAYGAKDGTFNSIEEVMLIQGMDQSLYKKLQDLITVHSMQSRVRINSAPLGVLKALPGLSDEIIAEIITSRQNGETAIIPIVLPDSVKPLVFASGQGNLFSIISEAQVGGLTSRLKLTLARKRSGNKPITILDWQENVAAMAINVNHQQEIFPEE